MKNAPGLVKVECPFGNGDAWIEATANHFALVDFRADFDGQECISDQNRNSVRKAACN